MSSVENEPLMDGLESTMIATTLPTRPNTEIVVSRMPEVMNLNSSCKF